MMENLQGNKKSLLPGCTKREQRRGWFPFGNIDILVCGASDRTRMMLPLRGNRRQECPRYRPFRLLLKLTGTKNHPVYPVILSKVIFRLWGGETGNEWRDRRELQVKEKP